MRLLPLWIMVIMNSRRWTMMSRMIVSGNELRWITALYQPPAMDGIVLDLALLGDRFYDISLVYDIVCFS